VTAWGATTFGSLPSWQRPHIICIGHFAVARLSCGPLKTAIQGQPCSEYVEICARGLQRFGLPDGFDLN